jgi:nucleoporin NDC1
MGVCRARLRWRHPRRAFSSLLSFSRHDLTRHLQPITAAAPLEALVAGASATEDHIRLAAFAALNKLASAPRSDGHAADARATLFSDQRFTPSMWAALIRAGLKLLGEDYQRLLARGAAPAPGALSSLPSVPTVLTAPTAAPAPAPPKVDIKPPPATSAIQSGAIFRHAPPAPLRAALDGLAAGSALDTAAAAVSDSLDTSLSGVRTSALPELFRSVGAGALVDAARREAKQIEAAAGKAVAVVQAPARPDALAGVVGGAREAARTRAPPTTPARPDALAGVVGGAREAARTRAPVLAARADALAEWWGRPRPDRAAEASVPRGALDALVVSSPCLSLRRLMCR